MTTVHARNVAVHATAAARGIPLESIRRDATDAPSFVTSPDLGAEPVDGAQPRIKLDAADLAALLDADANATEPPSTLGALARHSLGTASAADLAHLAQIAGRP